MKTAMISLAAVLGIFVLVAVFCVGSYINAYNYGNSTEAQIKAEYSNMENILGQYSLKVAEAAQVPAAYRDDLKTVVSAAMTGRYGQDGSKAVFQFIKEQNVQVDSSVYKQLQQTIEGGRNQFENSQTKFIDVKRVYETNLGSFWTGTWLKVAGYPKINLAEFKLISSEHAQDTFKTGVDKGLKIR